MKRISETLLVSGTEDGKAAVRQSMESIHLTIVQPEVEDAVFKEAVELVTTLTEVHCHNLHVKDAAGELLKQLVIAQGVSDAQVSQEGFVDLLYKVRKALTNKDRLGVKPTDRKPGEQLKEKEYTDEGKAAIKTLLGTLDKYYLNDHWLDAQTFVTGPVKGDDISVHLVLDNELGNDPLKNVDKAILRIAAFAGKWDKVLKKLSDQAQVIQGRMDVLTKGAVVGDVEKLKEAEKIVNELNSLPDPMKDLPKFEGTSLGNLVPKTGKYGELVAGAKMEPKRTKEMPALTKDQVKEAALVIKRLYTTHRYLAPGLTRLPWLDHSDGSEFNNWLSDSNEDLFFEYYSLFYHQGANQMWAYGVSDLIDTHGLAIALERWIDRSIV